MSYSNKRVFNGKTYKLLKMEYLSKTGAEQLIKKVKSGSSIGLGSWKFLRKVKLKEGWLVYGRK